jgi:hypothetical protein
VPAMMTESLNELAAENINGRDNNDIIHEQ